MMKKNNEIKNKRKDTKKLVVILTILLVTVALCGCNKNKKPDVIIDDEPIVTAEATAEPTSTEEPEVEATSEPTEEPVVEATPAPTEEPTIVYEGINMESDLPGEEWVETFVGIIEEPKIVVFSDETGRKEIFENDSIIKFNPDTDMIGVYLPEGYTRLDKRMGITDVECIYYRDHFVYFETKTEETRNSGVQSSALYVEYNGEEIKLPFVFVPQ